MLSVKIDTVMIDGIKLMNQYKEDFKGVIHILNVDITEIKNVTASEAIMNSMISIWGVYYNYMQDLNEYNLIVENISISRSWAAIAIVENSMLKTPIKAKIDGLNIDDVFIGLSAIIWEFQNPHS